MKKHYAKITQSFLSHIVMYSPYHIQYVPYPFMLWSTYSIVGIRMTYTIVFLLHIKTGTCHTLVCGMAGPCLVT